MRNPASPLLPALVLTTLATPASAQWSELTMPMPQGNAGATAVGDYLMYAGGFQPFGTRLDVVQVYDTAAQAWIPSEPLSLARQNLRGVTLGTRAIFCGGAAVGITPTNVIDVYDSSAGPPSDPAAWSTLTMPTPRRGFAVAAVGTKLFCARGLDAGGGPIADADIYDFATGTWSNIPLSEGGEGAKAVTLGSKVLIAGGIAFGVPSSTIVDVYDDATGTWSTTQISEARNIGGAAVAGDLAFFAGGGRDCCISAASSVVDVYDDSTGVWMTMNLARGRGDVAVAAAGGQVFFAGGDISGPGVPEPGKAEEIDVYDLTTGSWTTSRLTSRRATNALVVGNSVYFAGGTGPMVTASDRVDVYTVSDVALRIPGDAPDVVATAGSLLPVEIVERTPGAYAAGSAVLEYDLGAGPVQVPLVVGGPTGFLAPLPAMDCGDELRWSLSAASTTGTTVALPDRAPTTSFASRATNGVPDLVFRMDAADGWTSGYTEDNAVDGLWERGVPFATAVQTSRDHSPGSGGECWVTGLGTALGSVGEDDIDGGRTSLLSPVIDLTDVADPWLTYWRWLYIPGASDRFWLYVTDDGVDWIEVEVVSGLEANTKGEWVRQDIRLLDVPGLELTSTMQFRFTAADRFGDNTVEAAIDDVLVTGCRVGPGGIFCESTLNSTGAPSRLVASGSADVADGDVTLMASDLPPNSFGFFLASLDRGVVQGPGGSAGTICLSGQIGRYVGPGQIQNSGASGSFDLALDLANTPSPVGFVSIAPGETWHFQAWHRDSGLLGPTSNFTTGYVIAFE